MRYLKITYLLGILFFLFDISVVQAKSIHELSILGKGFIPSVGVQKDIVPSGVKHEIRIENNCFSIGRFPVKNALDRDSVVNFKASVYDPVGTLRILSVNYEVRPRNGLSIPIANPVLAADNTMLGVKFLWANGGNILTIQAPTLPAKALDITTQIMSKFSFSEISPKEKPLSIINPSPKQSPDGKLTQITAEFSSIACTPPPASSGGGNGGGGGGEVVEQVVMKVEEKNLL